MIRKTESKGTRMTKVLCCRTCQVQFELMPLADGSVAVICLACDAVGLEHDVARGGPVWPAAMRLDRPKAARTKPAPGARLGARAKAA
jgi:hypothetical protein